MVWTPYCGAGPSPAEWLGRWNGDPWLLAGLGVAAALIAVGLRRGLVRRPIAAWSGLALCAVMFVSPLCALASALFAARTAHHLLLIAAAAPLLALAAPARDDARARPFAAALVHAAAVWAWHAPQAYAAALSSDAVYWLMQATLLAPAILFWRETARANPLSAAGASLTVMVLTGLLGAILTFAPDALYAPHALTTVAWGLSPLDDQRLAGLLMWAPGAAVYLAAALIRVGATLSREAGTA